MKETDMKIASSDFFYHFMHNYLCNTDFCQYLSEMSDVILCSLMLDCVLRCEYPDMFIHGHLE